MQLTTSGKVGLAALSPDGKLFTYTIDDLGQKSLWLGYVDGGNHIELRPPAEATYRSITFSPDGKDLYFSIRDEKNPKPALYRMPSFGGVGTKLLDEVGSFSLSPDGRSIAIARRDDVLGIDVASFPKDLSFRFDTISWSADGKRLAVSAKKQGEIEANEVAILDIGTGDVTRVRHENLREITKTAWLADGSGVIVTAIKPDSHSSVPQYVVYVIGYPDGLLHPSTFDTSNYGPSLYTDAVGRLRLSAGYKLLLTLEHWQLSNVRFLPAA
jgi:Tol biopolymer transport system component